MRHARFREPGIVFEVGGFLEPEALPTFGAGCADVEFLYVASVGLRFQARFGMETRRICRPRDKTCSVLPTVPTPPKSDSTTSSGGRWRRCPGVRRAVWMCGVGSPEDRTRGVARFHCFWRGARRPMDQQAPAGWAFRNLYWTATRRSVLGLRARGTLSSGLRGRWKKVLVKRSSAAQRSAPFVAGVL